MSGQGPITKVKFCEQILKKSSSFSKSLKFWFIILVMVFGGGTFSVFELLFSLMNCSENGFAF